MKSIAEILPLASQFLEERKIDQPKRLAEDVLAHTLKLKRIDLYLQYDRPIVEGELEVFRSFLKRIAKGEPFEYIAGSVDFFGCQIQVDPRVLIPRPETEILASLIAKRETKGVLWDVCAGSGSLGISLKKKCPDLQVCLSDISSEVLELAKDNASRNGVEVSFVLGDLLAPFEGKTSDVIVCNPPYISEKQYLELDPSVREFEPKLALLGGMRGTEIYERLANDIPRFLNPGGRVYLEIGADQGQAIQQIFHAELWKKKQLLQDWSGKDRFFFLEN